MPRKANPMTAVLKNLSVAEVRALFEKKMKQEKKRLPALKAKLKTLMKQVAQITKELEAIEGVAAKPVRKRRRMKKRAAKKVVAVRKKTVKKTAKKAGRKKAAKKAVKKTRKKVAKRAVKKTAKKAKAVKPRAKKAVKKKVAPAKKTGARKVTVRQAIATAIKNAGKPIGPSEISKGIISQKLLPSPSKSLSKQVANALLKHDEFTRVAKGKYGLK